MIKRLIILTVSLILVVSILFTAYVHMPRIWISPYRITVNIAAGLSAQDVATLLKKEGAVDSLTAFLYWLEILRAESKLKAGTYEFESRLSLNRVIRKIVNGMTLKVKVTIPEGLTALQIAEILEERGVVNKDRFVELVRGDSLEGRLFPETYYFNKNTSEEEILRIMTMEFSKNFNDEIREKARKFNFTDKDVIILASLIEKEAKNDVERSIISAVFHNRLKKRWRLESCATVQYALGEWKPRLYKKDLEVDSPYNTYRRFGLPPGPISNPGLASLRAAVEPAQTDAMFFVADGEGTHIFSEYLEEHIKMKNSIKKKR